MVSILMIFQSVHFHIQIISSLQRRYSRIKIYIMLYTKIIQGGSAMIDYSPFWETLEKSSENWYTLTNKHHMSHSTLHRLKHNKAVSTNTINDICCILNCNVQDIMRYVRSEQDQKLQIINRETAWMKKLFFLYLSFL